MESTEVLEGVRKRPGMYVGDVHDGSGLVFLLRGLMRPAVEDHRKQRCFRIGVTVHRDRHGPDGGAVTVEDDGPGLPIEQTAFASLADGMDHLWLLPCANALGEVLYVESRRGGHLSMQTYRRGRLQTSESSRVTSMHTGTRFTFRPDPDIFGAARFERYRISNMLQELAFLNPGLRIDFTDQRTGVHETFHGHGLESWVMHLTEGQSTFPQEPVCLRGACGRWTFRAALAWTRQPSTRIQGFANLERVWEGAHVEGLIEGLGQGLKGTAVARTTTARTWDAARLRHGLVAVVEMRGRDLEVEGSCRERLRDLEIKANVRHIVSENFAAHLAKQDELFAELCALTRLTERSSGAG